MPVCSVSFTAACARQAVEALLRHQWRVNIPCDRDTSDLAAHAPGMSRFTCHNPHNVYDVIPCDLTASAILVAAAALQEAGTSENNGHPLQDTVDVWSVHVRSHQIKMITTDQAICASLQECMATSVPAQTPAADFKESGQLCFSSPVPRNVHVVWVQPCVSGAPQPLVLHSGSSCTHPFSYYTMYASVIYPFWSACPPDRRLCSKPYKPINHPTNFVPERSMAFRVSSCILGRGSACLLECSPQWTGTQQLCRLQVKTLKKVNTLLSVWARPHHVVKKAPCAPCGHQKVGCCSPIHLRLLHQALNLY